MKTRSGIRSVEAKHYESTELLSSNGGGRGEARGGITDASLVQSCIMFAARENWGIRCDRLISRFRDWKPPGCALKFNETFHDGVGEPWRGESEA